MLSSMDSLSGRRCFGIAVSVLRFTGAYTRPVIQSAGTTWVEASRTVCISSTAVTDKPTVDARRDA
jgi:hypothetical protein